MYYSVGSAIKNIGSSSANSLRRCKRASRVLRIFPCLGLLNSDERVDAAHPVGISI